MKKPCHAAVIVAIAVAAGGIYAAANSNAAKTRRRKKFVARAMKNACTVVDHISAFL